MVAVARNICTAKKHTSGAKNIYYLLSLIHYLLSKVPRLCKRFLSVRSAGVLFRAESVRAALGAAQNCGEVDFRAVTSPARTIIAFMLSLFG